MTTPEKDVTATGSSAPIPAPLPDGDDASPAAEGGEIKLHFKNGKATAISAWIGMKLTTRQYENLSPGFSITMALNDDADLNEAAKEIFAAVKASLAPVVKEVRLKYPVSGNIQ